jgi:hypothetical protein
MMASREEDGINARVRAEIVEGDVGHTSVTQDGSQGGFPMDLRAAAVARQNRPDPAVTRRRAEDRRGVAAG